MRTISKLNDKDYISFADSEVNYFEISGRSANSGSSSTTESFGDWESSTLDVGDYKVIPYGSNNDIPKEIQDTVFPNHLANRLQNRKVELLIEQGPYLYAYEVTDEGKRIKKAIKDDEILAWLEADGYEENLIHNATEYYYSQGVFTKLFNQRGMRIGSGGIAKTESLSFVNCRLAYKKTDKKKKPTHVIIGDWNDSGGNKKYDIYPLFDAKEPLKHKVCVHYSVFKSFGLNSYAVSEVYSSLPWIRRSTAIPQVLEALTNNSLNIKWHIQSPAKYWEDKKKQLKDNCSATGKTYKEQMLEDLKKSILDSISKLLSGVDNVGKFWHNEQVLEIMGGTAVEHGWKITPIEQKVKDYVKAQLEIATKADFATVAGLGLHSALANVGADGKSDSGSEQLYALKNHQLTSTPLPEFYICKSYNDAIKVKWPDKKTKVGFHRVNPEREQDLTSSKRAKNQES
ncbi:MAG: hypothetical protein HRT69_15800 [Flavobacteriaceae bacterium]|nr:hypothetical protein [Flavobacteriaceae bacterium]